jgi:hypothetical protein
MPDEPAEVEPAATEGVWFWTTLLAVGLLIGGAVALFISSTRVVLPYDETSSASGGTSSPGSTTACYRSSPTTASASPERCSHWV